MRRAGQRRLLVRVRRPQPDPSLAAGAGQRGDQALRVALPGADRAEDGDGHARVERVARSPVVADVEVGVAQQHLQDVGGGDRAAAGLRDRSGGLQQVAGTAPGPRRSRRPPCCPMSCAQRAASSSALRGKSGVITASCTQRPSRSVSTTSSSSVSGRIGDVDARQVDGRALVGQRHRAVLGVQHRERADDAARAAQLRGVQGDQKIGARPVGAEHRRQQRGHLRARVERTRHLAHPVLQLLDGPDEPRDQGVRVDRGHRGLRPVRARPPPRRCPGRPRPAAPGRCGRRSRAPPARASTSSTRWSAGSASRTTSSSETVTTRTASRLAPAHGRCSATRQTRVRGRGARGRQVRPELRQPRLELVGVPADDVGPTSVTTSLADSSAVPAW